MPPPKPEDFLAFKKWWTERTGSDEKLASVRALSFNILWALGVGHKPEILRDLVELLEFEISLGKRAS